MNRYIKEEVYVAQPLGFEVFSQEHKVCRLKKALYGLKQAPRAWYQRIDGFFHSINFKRSTYDASLYVFKQDRKYVLIVLYVDDLVITGDKEKVEH